MVRDLHGQEALDTALTITNALFKGQLQQLSQEQRAEAVKDMDKLEATEGKLEDILVSTGIASSKREAREWTKQNSIAVNGEKIKDPNAMITLENSAYSGDVVLIKRGKKNNYAVVLSPAE